MPRIRTIKPEFWEDEKIGNLPIECRLLFIGCWNFADDQGVFRANPTFLKSRIFPYDEHLKITEIKKWLQSLETFRMILPVIYEGESYYLIRTFTNHQVIDKRYNRAIVPQELITNILISQSDHHVATPPEMEKEKEEEKISTDVDTKESGANDPVYSPEYNKFLAWLEENAPYCAKHMKKITQTEMNKLKSKYTPTQISEVILQVENRKDLRKKYTNLYRTTLNWAKKEYGN